MITKLRTPSLSLLTFALLLLFSFEFFAQERQQFSGAFQVGKFKGEADYSYKVIESDTILDGPFQMERSNLGALLESKDHFFSFSGAFEDDYPKGNWKFQFGEFQSDSSAKVEGYQYRLNIRGIQHEAQGTLQQGKPDGEWTYVVSQIANATVNDTLYSSSIAFDAGVPQKSFRIQDQNGTLVGRFLRNGLAHDVWTFYAEDHGKANQSWYFSEGILTMVETEIEGRVKTIPIFPKSDQSTKTVDLDSRYMAIARLKMRSGDTLHFFEQGIPPLLKANRLYYQKIDRILGELGKAAFMPDFQVKVPHFPMDSVEKSQFDTIKVLYQKSNTIRQNLLKNTQLHILRRSDAEAQFLYAVVLAISDTYLEPLGTLVGYGAVDILDYVSREELMQVLWPKGKPAKKVQIDERGDGTAIRTFVGPEAQHFDFDSDGISVVYQLADYAFLSLDSIQQQLGQKLVNEKRQQEFIALEEQLISSANALNRFIDSVAKSLPRPEREALMRIKGLVDSNLKQYSQTEEAVTKLELAKTLLVCFRHFHGLAITISEIPTRWQTIQETYKDAIWNPFTATIMNEEVKKRITTAYRKLVIPYLLDTVREKLDCGTAQELEQQMDGVYQRVLQLREENTSKLERKLRKEQDPEVILQLLDLTFLPKKQTD
ncbi:MAG: hypothetical protein AAGB24_11095 [Bacteroidota bacterium]